MGDLTTVQKEMFAKNPRFIGLKFPEITSPETLEKKYLGKLSPKAINLLEGMLNMDPSERMTALEALTHSYFDDLRKNDEDFLKIIEDSQSCNDILPSSSVQATRPIQSSQGPTNKRSLLSRQKHKGSKLSGMHSRDEN